jgi:NO-binding membrane sensor protein with MHYT domain
MGDLLSLMYPFRHYLGQSVRDGTLPFWNPHTFAGSPFLANPISAVFYPPNWLFFVLPTKWAWSLLFPLRIGLAAFFAALLGRRVGATRSGALLSGLVFSLSGFLTAWQGWPQADCLLWAPLILLCLIRLRERAIPKRIAWLACAVSMPLVAGHPEVALYTLATGAAFSIFLLLSAIRRGRSLRWAGRFVGALALSNCLALGLCAVQLLPSLEWLSRITRTLDRPWGPRSTSEVVVLVSRDAQSSPNSAGLSIPDTCSYAGISSLLLAPMAFFGGRRTRSVALFFALLAVIAIEIPFGLFPASQLFRALPGIRGLPGTRILGILDLSLAVLAGLGLSALQKQRRVTPWRSLFVLSAAITAVAIGIVGLQRRRPEGVRPDPWRSAASSAVVLLAAAAPLAFLALRRKPGSVWATRALLFLSATDLLSFSWGHVPFVGADAVFPESQLIRFLKARADRLNDRVLFLHGTAPWNVEMVYGLYGVGGYPQVLKETARLLSPLNGGTERDEPLRPFRPSGVAAADPRLMDLLGIRWIVATTYKETPEGKLRLESRFPNWMGNVSLQVYENPSALPKVFLVPARNSVPESSHATEGDPLPTDFDPRHTVMLDQGRLSTEPLTEDVTSEISSLRFGRNVVTGKARARVPSILIMTQVWYPGWRARLDGKEIPLRKVDRAFCAMEVPPGEHQFEFQFRPTHFDEALLITVLSLCTTLGLLFRRRRQRSPVAVKLAPGSARSGRIPANEKRRGSRGSTSRSRGRRPQG